MDQLQSDIAAIIAFCVTHKAVLIPLLVIVLQQVASIINGNKKFAMESSIIGFILDRISSAPRADSPGSYKLPGTASKAPVVASAPAEAQKGSVAIGKITVIALALFIGSNLSACAAITWSTPVVMFGPVAGVEEISKAHPAPATAAGFQLSIGLGQFDFQGHEFDILDLGALALGGVILPGSNPVGALQLGGEVGTLNGIFGFGILATPYAVDGSGFAQGGNPGTTFAAMVNVAAITAYLTSSPKGELGGPERLPRGGL